METVWQDKKLVKSGHFYFKMTELEKEYPEIVVTDEGGFKSVAYDKMTAILLQAIKEQQQEIDLLQEEVNLLKSKN